MPQIKVLSVTDIDPEESDEIKKVVNEAKSLGAYLHIEIRRIMVIEQ